MLPAEVWQLSVVYNGREIYVQNTEKQLGTITTTMPIRNITVADTGRVTATLADTDATWIMTYEADGSNSLHRTGTYE